MASAQIVLPVPGGPAKLNASARPDGWRSPKPHRLKIRSCCVTCDSARSSARLVAGGRTTSSKVRRGATDSTARRPLIPKSRAMGTEAIRSPYSLRRARSMGRCDESPQLDQILRQSTPRTTRMPGDQSPRDETPGSRRGEEKPDHRRQADRDDEDAAEDEDEPADVAGDFGGGEVDLRPALARRLVGRRNRGGMAVVPRMEPEGEQHARREHDADPWPKHGPDERNERNDDRAYAETRDYIRKRHRPGALRRPRPGRKRSDGDHPPECAVAAPLGAQTRDAPRPRDRNLSLQIRDGRLNDCGHEMVVHQQPGDLQECRARYARAIGGHGFISHASSRANAVQVRSIRSPIAVGR